MPRKTKSRIAELAEANALMRSIALSDDAAQIAALLAFLRDNDRARFWLGTLIRDEHLSNWDEICRDANYERLDALGAGKRIVRDLTDHIDTERPERRIYGGCTELEILLLIREFSGRQSRVGLTTLLVL